MAAITRWSTGSAVCSAVLRSPPLPSEPLLALRSANQLLKDHRQDWIVCTKIGRCGDTVAARAVVEQCEQSLSPNPPKDGLGDSP